MYRIALIIVLSLSSVLSAYQTQYTIKGRVVSLPSLQPLINCNIYVTELKSGTVTDNDGNFKLLLPEGVFHIRASFVGYRTEVIEIKTGPYITNNFLEIEMHPENIRSKEIIVEGHKELSSVKEQKLENGIIKKMPTLYSDVLRSVQIMPGVSSNNEFTSSYNVRGGNFDENLIYLNGYEVYRPFLLKVGMEENHSLINPDMVSSLTFFNGTFPVIYGDKMSSALDIDYARDFNDSLNISFRVNFLNSAMSVKKKTGSLNWTAGIRYAYPGMFLQKLQTSGLYSPTFVDLQVLLNYSLTGRSSIELFTITAGNIFEYKPETWKGHFKSDRGYEVNEVSIEYRGGSKYTFNTVLAGLRYKHEFSALDIITLSASFYRTTEEEKTGLNGDYFYSPDAERPWMDREYLKSRFDGALNEMQLNSLEFRAVYQRLWGVHELNSGFGLRYADMRNVLNENHYEYSTETLTETPLILDDSIVKRFSSIYYYLQDNLRAGRFQAILGIRMLYYAYNREFLVSPRATFFYKAGSNCILSAGYGYFYQPPFFYELRNQSVDKALKSQRAVHYSLGSEFRFKEDHSITFEMYYKDHDNLIPYYIEQLKLEYLNNNDLEAYAYGFDMMFKGKLRENGLDNWFTYSFMNSKERKKDGTDTYGRRLLDQRHTFQVFLQDRIPKWKNWQSHLRLTFGSGYLFHYRKLVKNETTGNYEISPTYEDKIVLPFYARADMGLSTTFVFENAKKLVLTLEVQNVFNKYNVAGYSFIQVFKDVRWPVTIPQMFSRRFFNLGLEYNF